MGIQGLLPQLKSIMVPIHIKDLQGCSVAVDTYSWLHKGALSCSTELCKGIPTSRHIGYCMHRVNLLRHFGVKPILVFDGGLLPMKNEQENKRGRVRKENLARAVEHESNGNSSAAYECYQKAVDISPLVARELIQVLKQENVNYIVAPYEADAQMTFLAASRQVEAVITEDSDLIPFGCPRIIFKMDKFGHGVQFQYSMLHKNKELSFEGFNRQMLLEMCILSGCDYLQSLPGMGLKRAHAIIKKFRSYDKVLKHLRYSGVSVPPFYEESFKKAILTFQYQRVYDPISEDVVHLSNIPGDIGDGLDYLGPPLPKNIAQGIAKGDLDPFTKLPFEGENSSATLVISRTSQPKALHSESVKKKIDLPVQKNVLTKYFCFSSLEAKRKFRSPQTTPTTTTNQCTSDSSSVSPLEHEASEAAASEVKKSAVSVVDSENWGSDPPAANNIENSFAIKISEFTESPCHVSMVEGAKERSPEHALLRQPRRPIHKPCLGLHKDHEHTNVQDTVEGKTREATTKVIVQSAYFKHKQVETGGWDEKQDHLVRAGTVIDENKNTISERDLCNNHMKNKLLKRKISPNDNIQSENLQPRQMYPASPPHDNGRNQLEEIDVNSIFREGTRKVIVRSAYFKHKQVESGCKEKQDRPVKVGSVIDDKNTILDSDLCNNHLKNKLLKRKISPNDNIQNENLQPRQMHSASPPHDNGYCDEDVDRTAAENKAEEKFGANISHLGHYSEIAEKSMEKFVSVISSFRCSSGSRASGLRAPLRDVQNTDHNNNNNKSATVDFRQYAFVPKRIKTSRISPGS